MGRSITAEAADDFVVLPKDSVVTIRVDATSVVEFNKQDGGTFEKLDFECTIVHVPGDDSSESKKAEGQKIWGGVGFRLTDHPDNKLKQWVEALLGIEISQGFELDTDMLSGRQARAIIENYETKTGGTRHKIGALLPLTDQGQSQAASALGQQPTQPAPQPAQPQPAPVQQDMSDIPF